MFLVRFVVALVLLALFFPIGVPLILDGCGGQTWLNLLLCILGWIPGVIHAFWMINRGPKRARQGPNVIYVERGVCPPAHPFPLSDLRFEEKTDT